MHRRKCPMRISIWVTPAEHDQLGALARAEHRGLREQIEYLLSREIARETRKRARRNEVLANTQAPQQEAVTTQ